MRPVKLEFAGLQSYREPQSIDFEELLKGGLFGIFGPTGSGKSTILDAITLALYGTVARARNNTTGIMNQAEKQLWVKFTFELHGAGKYRVERAYKRVADSPSAVAGHCRLVEITPAGETVLADKVGEINRQVTEILGLTVEDFTRAVVLPQGKFAEFLQLAGSDRRRMLERLFSLADYGDRLMQRLKKREEEARGRLTGAEREQAGLGDASQEAVAEAGRRLQEAETAAAAADAELSRLETACRTWERVWELQRELAAVEAALADWQARSAAAEGWRSELDGARRAERVRHPLEAVRQARLQAEEADRRLAEADGSRSRSAALAEQAIQAHESARRQREEESPGLTERRLQLQRALSLESTLQTARAEAERLAGKVAKGRQLTAEVAERVAGQEQRLGQLRQEEERLRQQLDQATVDADHRSRIQTAAMALERLSQADAALAEANGRLQSRARELARVEAEAVRTSAERAAAQSRLEAASAELTRLEAEPPAPEEELRSQEAWLGRADELLRAISDAHGLLARREAEVAARKAAVAAAAAEAASAAEAEEVQRRAADEARQRRDAAQRRLEAARQSEHAAALVHALRAGEPCPVCGSTEHPHPALPGEGADLTAAQEELGAAEQALRRVEEALEQAVRQMAEADSRWEAARLRESEGQEAARQAEEQLQALRGRLPAAWQSLAVQALPQALAREKDELAARRQQHDAWQQQVKELRSRREDLSRLAGEAASAASAAEANRLAAAHSHSEAAAEAERRQADQADRRAEFDQLREAYDAPALQAEQNRIAEADREAQRLTQRLARLREERQAAEAALEADRRKQEEYTNLLHQRELELAAAEQKRTEIEAEWQRVTGGQPAEPLLQGVEAALTRLSRAEAEAQAARQAAEQSRERAAFEWAAAAREAELSRQRVTESARELVQAVEAAGFPDAAGAEGSLRPPERQQELDRQLQAYQEEGVRYAGRRGDLHSQLAGRSLTAEQWQGWQEQLEAARTTASLRRDDRTRAAQACEDLKAKQQRWQALEEERLRLATALHNLEDLKTLLRGNAFVEFLAEEQMSRVAAEASLRLGLLTRYRYALEVSSDGGFVIRDDGNGGTRRSVGTLSGGETFLTSLALALALSAQIQLRGHYPLEFFFLDEGFGTLDPELLDTVISTLERLQFENLRVGVISHVPELRSRLSRRVIVEPAEPGGRGSLVRLETA